MDEEIKGMIHEISRDEIEGHEERCARIKNPPMWAVVMAILAIIGPVGGVILKQWTVDSGQDKSIALQEKTLVEYEKKMTKIEATLDEMQSLKKTAEETNRETKAMREDIRELLKQGNR